MVLTLNKVTHLARSQPYNTNYHKILETVTQESVES